ncbi:Uncharacterised protein [Mycobacterium xenopi]|uniref:Uncharacterized protein n=1 Tax=Mycobacterium xenopi TaxID=1789 RepID=A0AAD1H332_MYCXE|nr:hypothetical protein MYXE_40790 [Mycobacterium xenopi]SPX90407.1 Uncharacterised protein [Mycobacterium xenopi]
MLSLGSVREFAGLVCATATLRSRIPRATGRAAKDSASTAVATTMHQKDFTVNSRTSSAPNKATPNESVRDD